MGECLNCKRYQLSASMWRNEAYKHAGIELPWKPEELLQKEYERGFADGKKWVGLTDGELRKQVEELTELCNLQSQRAMDYAGAFMRSKREWVGLTDEEILSMRHLIDWTAGWTYESFVRAVETKLREKNS